MTALDAVVVPSTLALLPEYAGLADPVPDVRSACSEAVSWLVRRHPDRLMVAAAPSRADNVARGVAEAPGDRIARHLLAAAGFRGTVQAPTGRVGGGLLVVANGSASRTDKAPGHLRPEAAPFDEVIGAALRSGDPAPLLGLDQAVAEEQWCFDVPALQTLGRLVAPLPPGEVRTTTDYDDDPFGVQYWVVRWTCGS